MQDLIKTLQEYLEPLTKRDKYAPKIRNLQFEELPAHEFAPAQLRVSFQGDKGDPFVMDITPWGKHLITRGKLVTPERRMGGEELTAVQSLGEMLVSAAMIGTIGADMGFAGSMEYLLYRA